MRLIRRRAIEIQAIWADRAKAAGAPAMTTAALHLLTVDAAHDRARRLKQIVAATDGPAAAAQAVLEIAAAHAPEPQPR
jgi:hypothetical protein